MVNILLRLMLCGNLIFLTNSCLLPIQSKQHSSIELPFNQVALSTNSRQWYFSAKEQLQLRDIQIRNDAKDKITLTGKYSQTITEIDDTSKNQTTLMLVQLNFSYLEHGLTQFSQTIKVDATIEHSSLTLLANQAEQQQVKDELATRAIEIALTQLQIALMQKNKP